MSEIRLSKKEILGRLNSIKIKPSGLQQRRYGVSVKYFSGNEESPSKRIDYTVTAHLNIEYGKGVLSLNKENIFYNHHEADQISEIISSALSATVYPVEIDLNEKGTGTGEITNYDKILERWNIQKSKLSEKYSSDDLTEFFTNFEKKLQNKTFIEQSLRYDWYWNLFFHPKFIHYGDTRSVTRDLYLAVIPYQEPLKFSGRQTINKFPTDYHSFVIEFESLEILAPDYFYPKEHTRENPLFMTLKVIFDHDLYHHFPMHTRAYFEVFSKDRKGVKSFIKKIQYTQYQIGVDEYKNKVLDESSPFITGGLVKVPPNKWGFDNFERIENDW
ncbi:hypothetical protein [Chryseobacterium sp.]|uniref:hypothetical protein n=1 Tax=Chryseobacterium sp. TaxID=1871047 RepID=UPI000EC1FEAF|nr:hypothetical protein [Chryseobacterium sp.]HCM36074.1 hypothetical protein [Chryseobacterium sp.]